MSSSDMVVDYGGSSLSFCDSERSALLIFFRGCIYSCSYCQNKELKSGNKNLIYIDRLKELIDRNSKFSSEVIFSGGEPFCQIKALTELARYTKGCGLLVGVETSGYNSSNAIELFNNCLIDHVYLDFKTSPDRYTELTGYEHAFRDVKVLMFLCRDHKVDCELRVTEVPGIVTPDIIEGIRNTAEEFGFDFRLQRYREC